MLPAAESSDARAALLARWLWLVVGLILAIVVIGGITRLTESGLSITEWKPITGVIPPLTEAQWQAEFAAYRNIPQYTQVNGPGGMTLADYKWIYFWEWAHRFLVRTGLGAVFVVPLIWFWWRGAIPRAFKPRLLAVLGLIGLQAIVGWWMVKSGLTGDADVKVSHFRLMTHLLLALSTMAYAAWTALDLSDNAMGKPPARLTSLGALVFVAIAIQLALGALVAGLRAGVVGGGGWFNWQAWPLMMGRMWPAGIDWGAGLVGTALHDPFLLHFMHRWWAWLVVILLVVLARKLRDSHRHLSIAIHMAFGTQILLGIATIWSGVAVLPAVLHQLCGALVMLSATAGIHAFGRAD